MKKGKPTLIEQSHNAQKAYIKAKERGDFVEADRQSAFIEWVAKQIRKGKK